jgi:hypothetical protein
MPRRATSRSAGRLLLPILAAAGLAGGCGYTASSVLPAHIRTIAIPTFGNNTVQYGLAEDVTQSLTDGFLADRRLRLERERDADSVLRGTILSYRNRVYAYNQNEIATQYEVTLVVKISYRDVIKNRDVWSEDAMMVRTTYNVEAIGSVPAQTEADGRKEVVLKFQQQVVGRTIQGW